MSWRLGCGLLGVLLFVVSGSAATGTGDGPPPGSITFVARNLVATAHGSFRTWRFTSVTGERAHLEDAVVEVEVDVASLDTANTKRDDHLRNDDFFDVERFPTAHVRLYGVTPDGESDEGHPRYHVTLEVNIRGIEKTVQGEFTLVDTDPPTVAGTVVLNRVDFGVGAPHRAWNPLSVREDVEVSFRAVLPDPF